MNVYQGPLSHMPPRKRQVENAYAVDLDGVETRMHRLAQSVDVLTDQVHVLTQNVHKAGTHAAAHEARRDVFPFFFWIQPFWSVGSFQDFTSDRDNMYQLAWLRGKFYLNDTEQYITKCAILITIPEHKVVKVSIKTHDRGVDIEKHGFMPTSQYKALCIFIISKSGSTDLLDDVIEDHIAFKSAGN